MYLLSVLTSVKSHPLTFSSDIWTLVRTIWDIISQKPLFEGPFANEDNVTCQQISVLDLLPTEWWEEWEGRRDKFSGHGEQEERCRSQYKSWENCFETTVQQPRMKEGRPHFESCERDALFPMLRSMLCFRPENRSSAQQVLESEWMVK